LRRRSPARRGPPGWRDALPTLQIGSSAIAYRLRRSRRARRLRITVQADGVDVVAPLRVGTLEIGDFVERHGAWVLAQVGALRRTLQAHQGPERLAEGGRILLRGDWVGLRVVPVAGSRVSVRQQDGFEVRLPARTPEDAREAAVEAALRSWLKRAALADAWRWVERHGPRHDLVPGAVRVKEHKHLWGSCSTRGTVNLNWRLIMAPEAVFEYVVVHELCHLRERHHQPAFWRLVGAVLPDYDAQRRWLRAHGQLLSLQPPRLS
jgi:predicted metal-dependent hydrolase